MKKKNYWNICFIAPSFVIDEKGNKLEKPVNGVMAYAGVQWKICEILILILIFNQYQLD